MVCASALGAANTNRVAARIALIFIPAVISRHSVFRR
jgi:hypothetical protein